MLWNGRAGKAGMRRSNDIEALCQTREERQRVLRPAAPREEEQRSPCALADDLQVNTLYDDGVDARLHRWPHLSVIWCRALILRFSCRILRPNAPERQGLATCKTRIKWLHLRNVEYISAYVCVPTGAVGQRTVRNSVGSSPSETPAPAVRAYRSSWWQHLCAPITPGPCEYHTLPSANALRNCGGTCAVSLASLYRCA